MLRRFGPLRMRVLFRVHVRESREVFFALECALRDKSIVRDMGGCSPLQVKICAGGISIPIEHLIVFSFRGRYSRDPIR